LEITDQEGIYLLRKRGSLFHTLRRTSRKWLLQVMESLSGALLSGPSGMDESIGEYLIEAVTEWIT
jgi:hypothetical protein